MKKLILAIAVMIGMAFQPAFSAGTVDETAECITYEKFQVINAKWNPIYYWASDAVSPGLVAAINERRVKDGQEPASGNRVVMGMYMGERGLALTGMAIFKDDCLIRGSSMSMPFTEWLGFILEYDLESGDFVKDAPLDKSE